MYHLCTNFVLLVLKMSIWFEHVLCNIYFSNKNQRIVTSLCYHQLVQNDMLPVLFLSDRFRLP